MIVIRSNPLGLLTTAIESSSFPLLQSSHIPWILDVSDENNEEELGILRGHIARANPQAKAIIESLQATSKQQLEKDVLVMFTSSSHHYVSPKFYTTTKPATGKVVPTWNYAAVQVYGKATIHWDTKLPSTGDFLQKAISDLSQMAESSIMGYERPWTVKDAPTNYIDILQKAIIGIEIKIEQLGGKWKMSQELSDGDKKGVIDGFESLGSQTGFEIADMVRDRSSLK